MAKTNQVRQPAEVWNGVKFMLHYPSPTGIAYPGKIGGVDWNKERLRRELQPVRDCIELFEEYGWNLTCHAYREWDGWSVEHGNNPQDRKPSVEPTDRQQLLLSWFARNMASRFSKSAATVTRGANYQRSSRYSPGRTDFTAVATSS